MAKEQKLREIDGFSFQLGKSIESINNAIFKGLLEANVDTKIIMNENGAFTDKQIAANFGLKMRLVDTLIRDYTRVLIDDISGCEYSSDVDSELYGIERGAQSYFDNLKINYELFGKFHERFDAIFPENHVFRMRMYGKQLPADQAVVDAYRKRSKR